jgi:GTP-binding protein Era
MKGLPMSNEPGDSGFQSGGAAPDNLSSAGEAPTRCGFFAIIGAPNAGKSTLTNALTGAKVSIVTHKAQTTRALIRGVAMSGRSQIILVDTPGIFRPRRTLDRAMVEAAWTGARDADMVLLLVDAAKGLDDQSLAILEKARDLAIPCVLALNKIDRIRKDLLLALTERAQQFRRFERIFMISALTGDGVADLKAYLAETAPQGPWLYPEDQIADAPQRVWAAEVTREKLFLRLHEELPYSSTVETTDWKQLKDGAIRIEQTIFVERDSQKKIVLGAGGRAIKQVSMEARREIEEQLETKVHLFLFVKVRENWGEDPERYREMGLEFPPRADGGR